MLLIAMKLAPFKTGWLFYIDSANIYLRRPFCFLQPDVKLERDRIKLADAALYKVKRAR